MEVVAGAGLLSPSVRTAPPYRLWRPWSLDAALALAGGMQHPPTLIAGGTDLSAQFNAGLCPTAMVALDRVAELQGVRLEGDTLRIGAMTSHANGCEHPLLVQHLPGFAQAWRSIANVRVRFWATIGGNLMARRERYEMSVMLSALDARLAFALPTGQIVLRRPQDVWEGLIPDRSMLHHIAIRLRPGLRFVYDRSLRPVMTVAVAVDEASARAAVATEWLRPALLAVPASSGSADERSEAAFAALPDSFADAATSHWYLQRAGTVLLRRALEALDGSV